ncbi:MAG: hypothetical protein H6581_31630 [Bacteroidia bacterium]|nr:hypothetical protein [Bacteroidia bacterium]
MNAKSPSTDLEKLQLLLQIARNFGFDVEKTSNGIEIILENRPQNHHKIQKRVGFLPKGSMVMMPGFDDPLEDFEEYM